MASFIDPLDPWDLNNWGSNAAAVFRHKLSMFLAGLIMLTPHRIAILCANHVVARFHFPPSVVPLFLHKIHHPMELASFIGQFLSTIMTLIIDSSGGNENTKSKSKRVLSCIFIWAMFFSCVLAYIFFVTGDDYGHFDQFYWCIILITFSNGLFSSYAFGTNFNSALYGAGLPLSGFFTFVFHKICVWVSKVRMWDDFDYSIVEKQIFWINISLLFTAVWWTMDQVCQWNKTIAGNSNIEELFGKDAGHQWSPVLMLAFSLGTVYAFYPSISPYQLVDWNTAEQIDLWIVAISSIPTLLIAILDEVDNYNGHSNKLGPGGTGPGNYGDLVNNDGDADGAKTAKKVLMDEENKLTVGSAWTNNTDQWTNTHKNDIIAKLNLVSQQTTAANAKSKAGEAKTAIGTAISKLNTTSSTEKDAAERVLNNSRSKLDGIGDNTEITNAIPNAQNWNTDGGGRYWWHLIGWISGVPYVICMHVFISILHFPEGRISKFVHARPKLLWIIPITFNTVEELMEIISFSGAGKQSTQSGMMYNGAVGQFNGMFFLFVMNISMSPI